METGRITCGIDIGSGSTKVVLGPSHGCEIVRNEIGGHTTPTAISFSHLGARDIGATASLKAGVIHLNRLIDGEIDAAGNDTFAKFYKFNRDNEGAVIIEDNAGSNRTFKPAALLAMLLGKIKTNVLATIERVGGGDQSLGLADISYTLSVGPGTSEAAQKQLLDAAFGAGMTTATIIETSHCYGQTFQRKFPEFMDGRTVMVIDMGHSQTSVCVLQIGSSDDDENVDEATSKKVQLLKSIRNKSFGAGSVEVRLWHHFQSSIPALKDVKEKSRSGQRLLDGCKKLKHLLSQLPDGSVTVENVGQNDTDIKLEASRTTLSELCNLDIGFLSGLIKEALEGVEKVDNVEIVGGGCRIPFVRSTILEALPEGMMLSHSLDDISIALGGALVGKNCGDLTMMVNEETEERKQLMEAEQEMASRDQDMQLRADTLNKIESHVLEMRSAKHSKHASLLPTTLDEHLDELDSWVFSEEADKASKDDVIVKLRSAEQKTKDLCTEYFEAIQKEIEEKEREMEEEAKKAAIERAGQADEEEDDHDNRRLPKKRRMEIVMKNKNEANELFGDGNYKFAAARYAKALSHCAKFIDLSPDDIKEVSALKLTLNLNLALAYLKLEKPEQALRVSNDAVEIDQNSTKALYRRASVYYEKKNWDKAFEDANKAAGLAPEDKAVKKLLDRVEAQQKRQKAKEKKIAKKMAAGMFG